MEVIITGASSGIGLGLAKHYLKKGRKVHGISRRCAIDHPNYMHHNVDLSSDDFLNEIDFQEDCDYLLINNAGMLGNVGRLSQMVNTDVETVFRLNVFAPVKLMQYFARLTPKNELAVVNISSGAGRNPVPSWLSYCSSKAALDMASRVFQIEQNELKRNTRVYSVAPGVVDTPMQEQIRATENADFSLVERFRAYQVNAELFSPDELGSKLDNLLALSPSDEVLFSLRDF